MVADAHRELSRDAQIVKYIIQTEPDGVGRTRLMKLLYLADLEARRYLGRPISAFEYEWNNYGPFDRRVYEVSDELVGTDMAETGRRWYQDVSEQLLIDSGRPAVLEDLSAVERDILGYVALAYMDMPLKRLLKTVYNTEPMRVVQEGGDRGVAVPMDIVDNTARNEIGFDLEELVAAEWECLEGGYLTLEEFAGELRAAVAGAGAT